ncbi:MAG: hypothetical protein GF311_23630 [Candidatus Lokiarchaeota archaeon]|nr:hypothetical protein [Candidatus Lokiarchaeota archaeon]
MSTIMDYSFGMEVFPTWTEIVEWFLALPIHFQVLLVIGIFLIIAGSLVLVYYILKGLFYLLKAVAKGLKKLFTNLYYAISGKTRPGEPVYVSQYPPASQSSQPPEQSISPEIPRQSGGIQFCTECGNKITKKMQNKLNETGVVYCVFCGGEIRKE